MARIEGMARQIIHELPKGMGLGDLDVLLATWFGVGLLPKAPGTWGSLAALPLAWSIHEVGGRPSLLAAAVIVFVVGLWSAGRCEHRSGLDDPSWVVIDEIVGQWLVLVVVEPDLLTYCAGFLLFRVADILKPWPASWADRSLHGGWGIMLDDVFAALYGAVILFAVSYWTGL